MASEFSRLVVFFGFEDNIPRAKLMKYLIDEIQTCINSSLKQHSKLENNIDSGRFRKKEEYFQAKQNLKHQIKLNLWRYIGDYGWSKNDVRERLEEFGQGEFFISKNLSVYLSFSADTCGNCFGAELDSIGLSSNQIIRDLIASGILPPIMLRFLVLGNYDNYSIGTWLYDEPFEDSEILLFDYVEQKIEVLSNSLENFIKRGIECYKADVEQDYFTPNETALKIIRNIDGDNVLPDGDYYTLTYTEGWPSHWQKLLTEDRNQELANQIVANDADQRKLLDHVHDKISNYLDENEDFLIDELLDFEASVIDEFEADEKDELLQLISPKLLEPEFVFCSVSGSLNEYLPLNPVATFTESEGLTLVLERSVALKAGLQFEGLFKQITLTVHSSLEAVGLTAAVSNKLASKGISANVIAAFYHDHIFVPSAQADAALSALLEFSK